jgi:hypothetical protein
MEQTPTLLSGESLPLTTISSKRSQPSERRDKSDLIRLWIGKLSVNAGQALTPTALGVFEAIWQDDFADLDYTVLEAAFRKTLRECKFWPVKVADIREHIEHAEETATNEAAEEAWARVLEIRRVHWNPDIPGPFDRAVAELSERVRQAARAAGVWRDFTSAEFEKGALHTWAKKRFVESFTAYGELERDEFLLPDGEIKDLLAGVAQTKMLPAPSLDWSECRARGEVYRSQLAIQGPPNLSPEERLRVADELAEAARKVLEQPPEDVIVVSDEARTALRRQAETLKRSFPMRPEAFSENPQLRKVYERFGLEIPESAQTQSEPQAVEA